MQLVIPKVMEALMVCYEHAAMISVVKIRRSKRYSGSDENLRGGISFTNTI